jgi:hypothetical protein
MTLATVRPLLALPLFALLLGPLAACDEVDPKGSASDSGIGDDDDDDTTGDDDDTTSGDDDDDTSQGDDDDDDDGSRIADDAAGTYNGLAAGAVNDIDYDLTVVAETPVSVTVSGPGIDSFTIPLVEDGGVLQQGKWNEGTFRLEGDGLEVVHNPQGFTFDGSRI